MNGAVLDAIEREDAADDAVLDDRDRGERAHRARRRRSRELVRGPEVLEEHRLLLRDDRGEHAVADRERRVVDLVGRRRELADAEVRARVGSPEEDGGVEVERAAEELECVVHRLVDLLDARAGEALLGVLLLRGGLAGAEQAVAPRVVAEPLELALDARRAPSGGCARPRRGGGAS